MFLSRDLIYIYEYIYKCLIQMSHETTNKSKIFYYKYKIVTYILVIFIILLFEKMKLNI